MSIPYGEALQEVNTESTVKNVYQNARGQKGCFDRISIDCTGKYVLKTFIRF